MRKLLLTLLAVSNIALAAPIQGPNAPDSFYCTKSNRECISSDGDTNWTMHYNFSNIGNNIFSGCTFVPPHTGQRHAIAYCVYTNQTTVSYQNESLSVLKMHPWANSPVNAWDEYPGLPWIYFTCQQIPSSNNTLCPWVVY